MSTVFQHRVCGNLHHQVAANYDRPPRYFIPDWDDLVDPRYNFAADRPGPDRQKHEDEVYAHEIYQQPNYDGLLVSMSALRGNQRKIAQIRERGVHDYTRFWGPVIGDCGAFGYIAEKDPPISTREALTYYQEMGFDYGVSVDHLIVPAVMKEKDYRYHLTRQNAYDFLQQHRSGSYRFMPVGVAQGWSPESYRHAVIELIEWGYSYVALGGLARATTEEIIRILLAVAPVLTEDVDLHLFGVARDREGDEMAMFRQLGVTSFDSATYLRRAWMSATANYFTEEGKRYIALRISPVSASRPRVKSLLEGGIPLALQQRLEQEALRAVREYDRGHLGLEMTLAALLEIERLATPETDQHETLYRQVLEEKPWRRCTCAVCQQLGVEVIIFRGNDRNRRRGFHNTYVFYKRWKQLMESGKQFL